MPKKIVNQINAHQLNMTHFNVKLRNMQRNLRDYKPHELARDLAKLAFEAEPQVAINTVQSLELEKVKCNS